MVAIVKKLDNKLINMYTKVHNFQKFLPFSLRAAIYPYFYIKLSILSFRMLSKYTLKRIIYNMFFKNLSVANYNLITRVYIAIIKIFLYKNT